jgi:hypothetical protein
MLASPSTCFVFVGSTALCSRIIRSHDSCSQDGFLPRPCCGDFSNKSGSIAQQRFSFQVQFLFSPVNFLSFSLLCSSSCFSFYNSNRQNIHSRVVSFCYHDSILICELEVVHLFICLHCTGSKILCFAPKSI